MPAFLEAWRAGLFARAEIVRNIVAGVVVGVVALPLAMAFAIASGAKPEQGIYTALVAGLVVALFGGSRVQIAGPTGAFAVVLVGITSRYGFSGLQVVTVLAGAMLVALGLTRLGSVIRFIPESVVLGFTAGIAVVIWVGQWENFFGLQKTSGATFFEKLAKLVAALPHLHPATTAIGVTSLLVLVLWPKLPVVHRVPGPLVALVGGTVFVAVAHPSGVATIGSVFGGIPRGLPPVTLPHVTLPMLLELARPAFAIALLGAIESLLSATVADGMSGTRHDPNQELVGQGAANIAAACLGGFAATGAIARTATSIRHGGSSPLAGIVHSVVLLAVLLVLSPLAFFVPLTTLAAILFVVAYNMSEVGRLVRTARRAPRSDVGVMVVTLALAIFTDLSLAVEVGVILALLNFFRRMTSAVEVRTLPAEEVAAAHPEDIDVPAGVLVFAIEGPFFFGAVEQFESALGHTGTDPDAIVISLANAPFVDLTALVALRESIERFEHRGVEVALCDASRAVAALLERAHIAGSLDVPASASLAEVVDRLREPLAA